MRAFGFVILALFFLCPHAAFADYVLEGRKDLPVITIGIIPGIHCGPLLLIYSDGTLVWSKAYFLKSENSDVPSAYLRSLPIDSLEPFVQSTVSQDKVRALISELHAADFLSYGGPFDRIIPNHRFVLFITLWDGEVRHSTFGPYGYYYSPNGNGDVVLTTSTLSGADSGKAWRNLMKTLTATVNLADEEMIELPSEAISFRMENFPLLDSDLNIRRPDSILPAPDPGPEASLLLKSAREEWKAGNNIKTIVLLENGVPDIPREDIPLIYQALAEYHLELGDEEEGRLSLEKSLLHSEVPRAQTFLHLGYLYWRSRPISLYYFSRVCFDTGSLYGTYDEALESFIPSAALLHRLRYDEKARGVFENILNSPADFRIGKSNKEPLIFVWMGNAKEFPHDIKQVINEDIIEQFRKLAVEYLSKPDVNVRKRAVADTILNTLE